MDDIDIMFYQVGARPDYTSFLRFYWWNDNPSNNNFEFQIVVL